MMKIWDQYEPTLPRVLKKTCERLPEKVCLYFNNSAVTWKEVDDLSDRIAGYLLEIGVEHGDRVGVMCTIRPEYFAIYMACAKVGAVLVGFNILFRPSEVAKLAERSRPKVYFILRSDRSRQVFSEVAPTLKDIDSSVSVVAIDPSDNPFQGELAEILVKPCTLDTRNEIKDRSLAVSEEDAALIVFTSGSTGIPKATVLTHRNLLTNLAVQIRSFQMVESDRLMVHLPMNHVAAATELVVPVVMLGATMVMLERFDPRATLDAIQRHKVTLLHQVPTMYIMEFSLPDFEAFDLSSLRICTVAGAVTPPSVMARMLALAPLVVTGYGMTEMTGFVTYTEPSDNARTISYTVGKIAPEFELQIVDDMRQPVSRGGVGEVALRGECRFKHYFGDVEATEDAVDSNDWYYTGDIGYLDERGYLLLVDRKKMMYITGGYNVYPREIEDAVMSLEGVAMCACIGVPDDIRGEVGLLFVTAQPDAQITTEQVGEHCRRELAEYKVPRQIFIRQSLPLTPLGKIDKQALKSAVLQERKSAC